MPEREPPTSNEGFAAPAGAAANSTDLGEQAPVIGGYRILRVLGEGGMGLVYLAEQLEPVRRRVALKVIKPGMDSRSVLARFEAERQALAVMDHPSVAHVFDAGMTEVGHPFFAMEYVQGAPITTFCEQNKLPLEERLRLAIGVCDAVQHAHQKGIIHRDLKPSNIMVKFEGDHPHPRIIDFGVAKALSQRINTATFFTERGELLGTPEYMSPEQAETSGLDIDTRTDIYSLGVVLYELLTGELPFDPTTLRAAGLGEIQRIIREVDPPKPSTKLSSAASGRDEAAGAQPQSGGATSQAELVRRIRGDLDWITMKAMAKDRRQRYDSASRLAADLNRFLRREPVEARPPSVRYRCTRFVQRHRTATAAGLVVFIALVTGLSMATYGLVRAEQARRVAEQKAAETSQVAGFLQELFMSIRPATARTSQPTLRDILVEAEARLSASPSIEPAVESVIRDTIGATCYALGDFEMADRHLSRSAELLSSHEGIDPTSGVSSMASLGVMRLEQGRIDEAERYLVEALSELRRIAGPDAKKTLYAAQNLGYLYLRRGQLDEAEPLLREAFDGQRARVGADHEDTIRAGTLIGELQLYRGERDRARALTEDLLKRAERVLGDDHILTAQVLQMNGWAAQQLGELEVAERRYRRSLGIRQEVLGADHPDTLFVRSVLANLLRNQGRYLEALPQAEEIYEALRESVGDENPRTISALMTLASLVFSTGQRERSIELRERAVELSERVYGPEAAPTANAVNDLANMYWVTDPARAVTMYERVRDIRVAALGPEHVETASARMNLGLALGRAGELDRAEGELRDSVSLFGDALGPQADQTINANSSLIGVLLDLKKYDEASGVIEQTAATVEASGSGERWQVTLALHRVRVMRARGEHGKVIEVAQRAIDEALGRRPGGDSMIAELCRQMGFALIEQGDLDEAERSFEDAREMLMAYWGDEFRSGEFHETVAVAFEEAGHEGEARAWRERE